MDCQENPPIMYSNFEKVIARGQSEEGEVSSDDESSDED